MADVSQYCSAIAGDPRSVEVFTKEFTELKKRIDESIKKSGATKQSANRNTEDGSGEVATGVQESNQAYKKILS